MGERVASKRWLHSSENRLQCAAGRVEGLEAMEGTECRVSARKQRSFMS